MNNSKNRCEIKKNTYTKIRLYIIRNFVMKKLIALSAILTSISACESLKVADFPEDEPYVENNDSSQYEYVEYIDEPEQLPEIATNDTEENIQEIYGDDIPVYNYSSAFPNRKKTPIEKLEISPDVYEIVARRTINKMLDATAPMYEKAEGEIPTIYINKTTIEDENLPDGLYIANAQSKKLIENSKTFNVTNTKDEADYILDTEIDTVEPRNTASPAIEYRLILQEKDGTIVEEWAEQIRRIQNDDKSWW